VKLARYTAARSASSMAGWVWICCNGLLIVVPFDKSSGRSGLARDAASFASGTTVSRASPLLRAVDNPFGQSTWTAAFHAAAGRVSRPVFRLRFFPSGRLPGLFGQWLLALARTVPNTALGTWRNRTAFPILPRAMRGHLETVKDQFVSRRAATSGADGK
jgi:hypothetical protein